MTKMNKPKIIRMASESYPYGRIDSFDIKLEEEGLEHSNLIPLFEDLGFKKKDELLKLDDDFVRGWKALSGEYIFVFGNKKIKAHIIIHEGFMTVNFDSELSKKKIIKTVGKYFELPE